MDKTKLKIREYRKLKGFTQIELAKKIGISRSFLSELESSKYDISMSLLLRIADVLELCPFKLVDFNCTFCCKKNKLPTK